jgi:hypothetical protein
VAVCNSVQRRARGVEFTLARPMADTSTLNAAIGRLRNVFCRMAGTELTDSDLAALARLDDEECRILLSVLQEIGAIERRRRHVFVCRPSSWWTSAMVRPESAP